MKKESTRTFVKRRPDWRYRWGPTLEPGLGLGLMQASAWWPAVFAHGTRPGSARNGDMGPPSSRLTTRRKVHMRGRCNVVWVAVVCSNRGLDDPIPGTKLWQ
ncbi:hypothetical protein L3Q82_008005 [Scortum barcoo]|uniref:Uncharacterized protein n=1 Tax=Scortum barcoo TaxID=214431 RepID=A0ACB8WKK4_9TELE|nr:hypothetical protein L3Q82_008005 [Scortum barcoo]